MSGDLLLAPLNHDDLFGTHAVGRRLAKDKNDGETLLVLVGSRDE